MLSNAKWRVSIVVALVAALVLGLVVALNLTGSGATAGPAPAPAAAGPPASVTLTPAEAYNPIRTQHTLVAQVKDASGAPVSGARVEWVLNRAPGLVGDIVCLCGNEPLKVDNTFGISKSDDKGEARLTITATREGDTDITAYVPSIQDPAAHKVFAVKHWLDLTARFPNDAVNPIGTRHVMTVQVLRITDGKPLAGVPVRWDLNDSPQTAFFGDAAPGATSAVASTDMTGSATMTLQQLTPAQGVNKIRISVLAPANPAFVVLSKDITKTWQASILGLSKRGPEQIGLLGQATYDIVVQNTGDRGATGVVFTDTIPAGMSFVSADPAATVSGSMGRWDIGSVGTTQSRSVKLVLEGVQVGQWTNTVTATSAEGVTATAQATTRVVPGQLEITKTGPALADLGSQVTYQIAAKNSGVGALTGVAVVDTVPDGMSYISSSPAGTLVGKQVSWTVGTMVPTATQSFTLVLRAETIGTWTNTVRIVSTEAAPAEAKATTKVVQAVLDIRKTGPAEANLGADFSYDITVRNQGDGGATAVTVTDTLPAGLTFVSAAPTGAVSGNTVTWNVGALSSGASTAIRLTVKGNRIGIQENVVVVTSAQEGTDTARASTLILAPAVSIEKTGPSAIPSGYTRTYILSVTNTGEIPLNDVIVTDELPAGLSYQSSIPTGTVAGNRITWNLSTLAVRQQKTIAVVLRGEGQGTWTNVATVTTREGVTARSTLDVVVAEGFSGATMSLVDSIDPIAVGEQVTYTIVVDNQAITKDLHNMTIVAVIPSQMTFVSATGPTSWTVVGQEVRFESVGTIVPSRPITYTVTVRANAAGSVLFTSTMRYDEFPPGPILVQEATTIFAP